MSTTWLLIQVQIKSSLKLQEFAKQIYKAQYVVHYYSYLPVDTISLYCAYEHLLYMTESWYC